MKRDPKVFLTIIFKTHTKQHPQWSQCQFSQSREMNKKKFYGFTPNDDVWMQLSILSGSEYFDGNIKRQSRTAY